MDDPTNKFIEVFGGPHDGCIIPIVDDSPHFEVKLQHEVSTELVNHVLGLSGHTYVYQLDLSSGVPRYIHVGHIPMASINF